MPDHPLDYLLFEGPLPEGEYGAGEVIVWDYGEYEATGPEGSDAESALQAGTIWFILYGAKLQGLWAIFRTRFGDGDRETWLLEKLRDEFAAAGYDPESEPKSVLSGKVLGVRHT